jgi:hypothetical protein
MNGFMPFGTNSPKDEDQITVTQSSLVKRAWNRFRCVNKRSGRTQRRQKDHDVINFTSWSLCILRDRRDPVSQLLQEPLNRIRQTCKGKVTDFHRRQKVVRIRLVADRSFHFSQLFEIVEHDHRAFVETEVFHRILDLTILDIKSADARQSGEEQ